MRNEVKQDAESAAGCTISAIGCYATVLLGVVALALAFKLFFWILR